MHIPSIISQTAKVSIHLLLGASTYQHFIAVNRLHMIWYCGLVSKVCLTSILALTGFWSLCCQPVLVYFCSECGAHHNTLPRRSMTPGVGHCIASSARPCWTPQKPRTLQLNQRRVPLMEVIKQTDLFIPSAAASLCWRTCAQSVEPTATRCEAVR